MFYFCVDLIVRLFRVWVLWIKIFVYMRCFFWYLDIFCRFRCGKEVVNSGKVCC